MRKIFTFLVALLLFTDAAYPQDCAGIINDSITIYEYSVIETKFRLEQNCESCGYNGMAEYKIELRKYYRIDNGKIISFEDKQVNAGWTGRCWINDKWIQMKKRIIHSLHSIVKTK